MGRAVRCELSCGQATLPRGSVTQPFRCRLDATCKILAAPLDTILADIEHEDIQAAARATESAALLLAEERRCHKAMTLLAGANEQLCLEEATRAAESVALTLAEGHSHHKAATLLAAAGKHRLHKATPRTGESKALAVAEGSHCHNVTPNKALRS